MSPGRALHTRARLARELRALGLGESASARGARAGGKGLDDPGPILMVHASLRALGPVLGGVNAVILALLDALGASGGGGGTLMAYVDWEDSAQPYFVGPRAGSLPPDVLAELPPFDPRTARAARAYGVFPEALRTWPGALRSGNPAAGVAAVGPRARWLTADHPHSYGYGPGSPLAKLVEAGGRVLLLGAPLDTVTLLHHAEHLARLPGKRVLRYREPMSVEGSLGGSVEGSGEEPGGEPLEGSERGRAESPVHARTVWADVEEFDTGRPVVDAMPEDAFARIVGEHLASGRGASGTVGAAACHLLDAAELVRFAVAWMEARWGEPDLSAPGPPPAPRAPPSP